MSEDKKRDRMTDEAKRRFGRFWSTFAVVAIICCLVWKIILWNCRSPDEQLAAIEASLAIPDSENAGVTYIKLAGEYLPLPEYPSVADKQVLILTREEPWHSNDYPKLAAWLDERQDLISKLLEISKMEKCRLPILSDRQKMSHFTNPVRQMHGWTYLLIRSGNMDTGEGRIYAAIEKYICVLQMGSHLRQQPVPTYYNNGVANESLALRSLEKLITQIELTEKQLESIEAALLPPRNQWKQDSRILFKVQRLLQNKERRRFRIIDWRRYLEHWKVINKHDDYSLDVTHTFHLYTLTNRRRTYILIALKRYKNKTGHWPQNLDLIKPLLSQETLIDPNDNKPFVYELTGEDFRLSIGGAN
jgi:hypothetical protein